MDFIHLPIVTGSATLTDAIGAMQSKACTGVVVQEGSYLAVIDADQILFSLRKEGERPIGVLEPRLRTAQTLLKQPAETLLQGSERVEVQELLDKERAVYVVTRLMLGEAEIVTRHESYKWALASAPSLWRCTRNPNDIWRVADLIQPGDLCKYCGVPAVPL